MIPKSATFDGRSVDPLEVDMFARKSMTPAGFKTLGLDTGDFLISGQFKSEEDFIRSFRKTAKWVNDPSGDGMVLMGENPNNPIETYAPYRRRDGSLVKVMFSDIPVIDVELRQELADEFEFLDLDELGR